MAKLFTVASSDSAAPAHLARTLLESHGIKVFVIGDEFVQINPIATFYSDAPVRLQVIESDVERAREILANTDQVHFEPELGYDMCPKCKSLEIEPAKTGFRDLIAWGYFFVPVAILLGLWRRQRKCTDCGHKWKLN